MMNIGAKKRVVGAIKKDMGDFGINEIELEKRITIKLDVEQFDFKEDESVWRQKRGYLPNVCEVYFDDVWCCDLKETDYDQAIVNRFFQGFQKGYDSGKIRLNKFLAEIEDEKKAQEAKDAKRDEIEAIESLPASTPEERISKEIVKEIVKENNAQPTAYTNAT